MEKDLESRNTFTFMINWFPTRVEKTILSQDHSVERIFSTNGTGTTNNLHSKEASWTPYLTLYTKISSKWLVDLNIRDEHVRFLGKKRGANFYDLGLGNGFLDVTPKHKQQK